MSTNDDYVGSGELSGGLRAAEAPPQDDFRPPCDVLIAMRPFGHKKISINGRDTDAVDVYVITVDDDGEYEDVGMRDLTWQFVIRELDKCTDEAPWVVGTITKKSRAYFLVPPTVDDVKRASVAIDQLVADREAQEDEARGIGDEPF